MFLAVSFHPVGVLGIAKWAKVGELVISQMGVQVWCRDVAGCGVVLAGNGLEGMYSAVCLNVHMGGSVDNKKLAWVAWKQVCSSKDCGGLGMGSLLASNLAMLTKWWWRFKSESNSLSHQVFTSIFDSHGRLETNILTPILYSHVSPWKEIYGLNKDLSKVNINLDSVFKRKTGDGSVFKFWHDCWFRTSNFMTLFPRMDALETHKECLISERCVSGGLIDLSSHGHLTCSLNSLNTFTVSSMRFAIDSSILVSTIDIVKWNKTLPIKINIHSWRLRKDRLPTRSNLDARGIDLDSLRCPVCNDGIESTPHLFVWCTVAAEIWCMIKDWWGWFAPQMTLMAFFLGTNRRNSTQRKNCASMSLSTPPHGSFGAFEIEFALT
uniref:RNA-directed DNA polymerase, eukaryota, reverse transcriptase zinc-binding domain protein n=1 Tax=Tanacetum cinerariifolium TaxID=118510 RepID=A0A6L2JBF9_TANCI|nr:RNA-directed DNA polymerase, eukaryota, reverse transcriptase zinc-binding domain protein [Tanacetum cinerariifolium]